MSELYTTYKPLLFSLAYRMLGMVSDAEDVVHEVFIQVQDLNQQRIENIKAYLCKMITNKCLDHLKSAKKQREVYIGPWLPEPLILSDNDPLETAVKDDSISYAMLTLMEQLTPLERAIFILRESFEYEYRDIAGIVGRNEANCRKILSRVREKLHRDQPTVSVSREKTEELTRQFIYAAGTGNMDQFLHMLADDIILYSDGGGKVFAAIQPIYTPARVAKFISGLARKFASGQSEPTVQLANINGQTGVIFSAPNEPINVIVFKFEQNRIQSIFIIRNPDKLKHIAQLYNGTE